MARSYRKALRDPQVWRRTLLLGLPVGLMQATLNQGDHWWHHQVDAAVIAKSILSPLLSCSIALISALTTYAQRDSQSSST
jgi:hypothetical protein